MQRFTIYYKKNIAPKYAKWNQFSRMLSKDWNVLLIVVMLLVILFWKYIK
ncbi:MAG: hypothetical protein ACXVBA_15460 [Mucilaginibacter sp.]